MISPLLLLFLAGAGLVALLLFLLFGRKRRKKEQFFSFFPYYIILFFLQRLSWHFFSFSQFFRKKAALQSARPEKEKPQSRHSAINAPAQRSCWMWK